MTQTGKCDTCRQRKVKCDEERPKCGACKKKNRPCLYSYGKASAFVVQDPNQLTKHGKSKVAPLVVTLDSVEQHSTSSVSTPSDLQITTEREADNGQGFFQTLAPMSRRKLSTQRRLAQQRRKLEIHLQQLQEEAAMTTLRPTCSETTLIARYIHMLGQEAPGNKPFSILGTWINSIPARIGSNRMMDLAVEFFVNSYEVYLDDTYSKRRIARASKERALKELQLFVYDSKNEPTYEVLLATKMHYAAEATMGIDSMYHAIHAFGLAELLKSGKVKDVDDEHYWNLIDNTYIDDVNEAMIAGRSSVYDNEFYLSMTYPTPISSNLVTLSPYQRASVAIMHMFIQLPRLNCFVRHAVSHPEDSEMLATAITLGEYLWQINITEQVSPLLSEGIFVVPSPAFDALKEIVTESLSFDSVQTMVLCSRYWMLINVFGGLIDTLYRYYPAETSLSLLPDRFAMHKLEVDAAIRVVMATPWAESVSRTLPLVPLRLHTPLQVSIGPWYRTIQRLSNFRSATPDLNEEIDEEITRTISNAERMKAWLIERCNLIHKAWDVSTVTEKPLVEAINTMAGEKIPDWLPVRVRFEAEDGEMVMKLEYENETGTFHEEIDVSHTPARSMKDRYNAVWRDGARSDTVREEKDHDFESAPLQLPDRTKSIEGSAPALEDLYRNRVMDTRDAANYVHGTGRNLCSTSGWWPKQEDLPKILLQGSLKYKKFSELPTPEWFNVDGAAPDLMDRHATATLPLDSTHETSAFSGVSRPDAITGSEIAEGHTNRHPCLASSFWPQTPNATATPSQDTQSPWSYVSDMTTTFESDISGDGLSVAWTSTELTTPSSHHSANTPG